jgi:hypothetical protein
MQNCFRLIPCGKSMAHPNSNRYMLVIRLAFNMSFEFVNGIIQKIWELVSLYRNQLVSFSH